ncbi:MAG: 3-deoxy-D-manno-octulosonic acid transferase [Henriciella sp.]|nr:3-deoxy-D-manno-octulosonic acid transferase [Henriciella sp.]
MTPFLGVFFRGRVRSGKETKGRLNERRAVSLQERPEGSLIWLHAASVGESQLLLELIRRFIREGLNEFSVVMTCQTKTAAHLIAEAFSNDLEFREISGIQQMAPFDSAGASKRFIKHWKPDLAIFAEGEIWPNLLLQLHAQMIPAALINARMTENSIKGWMRWRKTARRIFNSFDLMIAADVQTRTGLEALSESQVANPGNLKSALPAPAVDETKLHALRDAIGGKKVLLAASTHAGEEALALDAFMRLPEDTLMIIAPRHPERGDEVDALLSCTRYAIARRSEGGTVTDETNIFLADTMGEMGLWYRLADTVYLGGGHAPGVGGHNPLEALRLGKPIVTGPSLFNFKDLSERLSGHQGFAIVDDAEGLADAFPAPPVSAELSQILEEDALGPMATTLDLLQPLRKRAGIVS